MRKININLKDFNGISCQCYDNSFTTISDVAKTRELADNFDPAKLCRHDDRQKFPAAGVPVYLRPFIPIGKIVFRLTPEQKQATPNPASRPPHFTRGRSHSKCAASRRITTTKDAASHSVPASLTNRSAA